MGRRIGGLSLHFGGWDGALCGGWDGHTWNGLASRINEAKNRSMIGSELAAGACKVFWLWLLLGQRKIIRSDRSQLKFLFAWVAILCVSCLGS